jgi:hypothetical protein
MAVFTLNNVSSRQRNESKSPPSPIGIPAGEGARVRQPADEWDDLLSEDLALIFNIKL